MSLYTAAAKKITHLPTIKYIFHIECVYIGGSYIIILLRGSVCFIFFNSVRASSWRSRWRTPLDFNYGSSNAIFFFIYFRDKIMVKRAVIYPAGRIALLCRFNIISYSLVNLTEITPRRTVYIFVSRDHLI